MVINHFLSVVKILNERSGPFSYKMGIGVVGDEDPKDGLS